MVAPARERGLKLMETVLYQRRRGRSRKGAWIEIKRSCYYENVL